MPLGLRTRSSSRPIGSEPVNVIVGIDAAVGVLAAVGVGWRGDDEIDGIVGQSEELHGGIAFNNASRCAALHRQ